MLAVSCIGALANTAEVTTGNLRSGAAFDNLKASWTQALKLGDISTNLKANYDYKGNKDFLSDIEFSGDLVEGGGDDMTVSYEVTHDFGDKNTNVKLSAETGGTTLGAEYDQADGLTEVTAARDVDVGDSTVGVDLGWKVASKSARIKLASKLGDSDSVNAEINYETEGGATTYELGYDRNLEDGRDVSVTFNPDSKNVEVEYTDGTFEKGATWSATLDVPLEDGNALDSTTVSLKRSWSW